MSRVTVAALLLGAVLATPAARGEGRDPGAPEIRRVGKTVVQFKDDAIQLVVGYKYASSHLDARWIVVDAFMTARVNGPVEIAREDIALVTPAGRRLSLPTQKTVGQNFSDLSRVLKTMDVGRDPLAGYFPGPDRVDSIGFFTAPGEGIVTDRVTLSPRTLTAGFLVFESPNGVFAPGKYVLEIYNKWVDLRLPFTLPADEPREEKRGDGKAVTW